MRRPWLVLFLLLSGCSTAPIADCLDHFKPGQVVADQKTQPYGGVCLPQGVAGPAVPVSPPVVPAPVAVGPPSAPAFPTAPGGSPIPPPPPPPPVSN